MGGGVNIFPFPYLDAKKVKSTLHGRSYQAHHMWLERSSTAARTSYGLFTNNPATTLTDISAPSSASSASITLRLWFRYIFGWFSNNLHNNRLCKQSYIWQYILLPLILTFIVTLCWIKILEIFYHVYCLIQGLGMIMIDFRDINSSILFYFIFLLVLCCNRIYLLSDI